MGRIRPKWSLRAIYGRGLPRGFWTSQRHAGIFHAWADIHGAAFESGYALSGG